MRRYTLYGLMLFIVSAFSALPAFPQTSQYALFHYHNDGDFNAFLNTEIDSITYSNIGLDNVEYDDIVVQEVWTPDSLYRIPIETIDSIGFRAPAPKYSSKTFPITDELLPYVISVGDLSITFSSSTPQSLLPTIGQILVADTWESPLDEGFAGRLTETRQVAGGVEYVCEEVKLNEVFESLVFVGKCVTSDDPNAKRTNLLPRKSWWNPNIDIPEDEVKISLEPFEFGEEDSPLSFKYTPSMTIKYEFRIIEDEPAKMKVNFIMRHDYTLHGEHKLELPKDNGSHEWLGRRIPIPIPIPAVSKIVRPYIQFGAFVDAKAKASFEFDLSTWNEMSFGVDYDETRPEDDQLKFTKNSEGGINSDKSNLKLSVEGSFATGLAIVLGANVVHKRLLNFEGHFHIGPMIKGTFELSTENIAEDANMYRQLKDTKVEVDGYLSVTAQYNILGKVKLAKRGTWKGATWDPDYVETLAEGSLQWTWPFFEWYLLPDFDKPMVWKSTSESAFCKLYPKRELLPLYPPLRVGVAFENYMTGEVIEKDYGPYSSSKIYEGENQSTMAFLETISPLEENVIYKVTPTVTLWDRFKMKAEPSVDYGVSNQVTVLPKNIEIDKGQTVEVEIVGGSGNYEVTDLNSNIARSVKLTPVSGQKKAILSIYGVNIGNAVFTVTDKQYATRTDINVMVTMGSEWGGLDDVPGTDL